MKIAIIGSGFSGLSAASYVAKHGHEVHIFEKNNQAGGRASVLKTDNGYTFDMGPSWYWMPDIYERFFKEMGTTVEEQYTLIRLDPAFEMIFENQEKMKIPASFIKLCELFDKVEKGSSKRLLKFMDEARTKYVLAMSRLAYSPGLSIREFADGETIMSAFRLQLFSSFSAHIRKYFTNKNLLALLEFPILFLGAMPEKTPALYSLMNYAGLKLGTWYPAGGFGNVVQAFVKCAESKGAELHFNSPVEEINVEQNEVKTITVNGSSIHFDAVIASADYHHIEKLINTSFRNYTEDYWSKKTFAPSCLIFYLGITKKINLEHHTLFFDEDLAVHAGDIYINRKWPEKPLFYACCPSKTDTTVAPEGHENVFLLMPLAPGLNDTEELREKYFNILLKRIEQHTGEEIAAFIDYKKSYCISDFVTDYNAYKGNAYGLANTLFQTAVYKPKIINKKLSNLFYAGQLTVPGPGVPPAIISGKIAAGQLLQHINKKRHEAIIR